MGHVYSYFLPDSKRKLCDDILDDLDFALHITLHNENTKIDYLPLLEHLQSTNPIFSYWNGKSIYLLYSPNQKHPHLRSNVSGDVISILAADVTRYCMINRIGDPYCVEVEIHVGNHYAAKNNLLELIRNNLYCGTLYGIDHLSEEKIKEQFN